MQSARLPESAVHALQPFFPDIDLASVRIRFGIPRAVRWFAAVPPAAVAAPARIYARPDWYDPRSLEGLARIAHELVHLQQYRRLGAARFLFRYFTEYASNRRPGMSKSDAYRQISLEREAFDIEREILDRLRPPRDSS